MSHRSVYDSSPAMNAAKRVLIGAALVAGAYLASLLVSGSAAIPVVSGSSSDAGAAASSAEPGSASRASRDFDYFPDHYTDQAREVAEQPATF